MWTIAVAGLSLIYAHNQARIKTRDKRACLGGLGDARDRDGGGVGGEDGVRGQVLLFILAFFDACRCVVL